MANSCRWLADTLVCVNIALTVRAGVCHILEVINQAGNQTAAKITPVNDKIRAAQSLHVLTGNPSNEAHSTNRIKHPTMCCVDLCAWQSMRCSSMWRLQSVAML